jgi:hypothetical protein
MPVRNELLEERRIDDRSSLGHPLECVHDVGHLHHPALEDIPDPGPAFEEIDRGLDLDVRRQQENADLRSVRTDRTGGFEAFPRLCRRHTDVGDGKLR